MSQELAVRNERISAASAVEQAAGLLHRLFFARAERTPDEEAVVWGTERWTCAELARRALCLAETLRGLGVGPEVPVGICARRTPDLIAGMLGILEAGGTYLPLDPRYPRERLAFMLEDAGAPLVLTDEASASALPESGARCLFLDRERAEEPAPGWRPRAEPEPRNLAYLIYTSGSTGRPKGVAIPHGAAVHLMCWARDLFPPEDLAGVLAATSVCFDLSVFEIFVPLSWGGRVILADNALALPTLPAAGEVTLVNTVPSAAAELVRSNGFPRSVRTINLAGEALKRPLVDQLYERTAAHSVYNLYGPSEDTTYSTWARVPRGVSEAPTIGVPLPGESAQVLDGELRPVARDHEGELFLGGPALARGYLGRPDLTAERFLPDPTAPEPGCRMYRTGDLVRLRPDGELDFLGRLDHQVKIRGFRIELGEIEAALLGHPLVRESVVVARGGSGTEAGPILVAYLSGAVSDAAELRRFLGERLPEHMIPSLFVVLPALPLTPNGKVNRKALPAPDPALLGSALYVAPRTPLEERLAVLWAEALGMGAVGVEDSFFELGGHSLLGTRLLWRLREETGSERSLRDLMEHPTVAAFAAALESGGPARPALPPLQRAARDGALPLTPNQLRLWLVHEQQPAAVAYNVPIVCRLDGRLDAGALRRSLEAIVHRHEALRTTFAVSEGAPVQVIHPAGFFPLPEIDLAALPAVARKGEAERIAQADACVPFDLERGPVLRATLLRLEPVRHRLVLTIHHIAWDEWSAEVFLRELGTFYQDALEGRRPELAALEIQVADYGVWQNAWSREAAGDALLAWWRERLASLPEPLALPVDRPRPAFQSGRGGRRWRVLPDELGVAVRELARGAEATPYMTFLAAFAALLGRIGGREDLVLGGLIAARTRPESEPLIGFLTNTVALRIGLAGAAGFAGLLATVREVVLGAMEHQDLPFDRVFEAVGPEIADRLRVLYTYYQEPARGTELAPGLRFGWHEADNGTAKLDLTLFVEERERGFALSAEYNADLFDPVTIDHLLERIEILLDEAVATPEAELADLPLLTAGEREQLARWNDTRREFPREAGLWELFATVAARSPESVALELGDEQVTYGELERRAERMARRLRAAGVGPGTAVGLCCERSAGLVVGMLGILRAGGFYVPLDPAHPRERLIWAVRTARVAVLVTQGALIRRLPAELTSALSEVVLVEAAGDEGEPLPVGSLGGDALAYVIFTSGSTGRPKGVAVPQRAVARLVLGTDYVQLGPELRMGQVSNAAFDAITYEVWGALLHGGRLVGIERDVALDPRRLAEALRERRIGSTFLTAALFQQVAYENPDAFAGMDQLLVGGDAVDPEAARAVLAAGPPRRLINGYGPTECTTFAVCGPIAAVPEGVRSIPIGRPIANTTAWVLDRNLRTVPVGVPGELCLGGDGLAWGYLGRPDLTALRFVPHPEAGAPGERLYQTGDLVRWRPDGTIEFLGRVDNQVKIRGFRIEPGEIEVVLCSHPRIQEAAVVPFEASPGDRRLAAFVVGREGEAPDAAELRAFLEEQLPEFMIPALFVPLAALPLNPNGKVDRRALAADSAALRAAAEVERRGYVPPRTAVEEVLAGIWEEVLDAGRVGAHDDFFELGGHSLLITRVLSRVRQALEIDLPPRALFEAPTVAALAERIAGAGLADRLPPIETMARGGDLPLSPAQQRLWFLERLEAGTAYNIPIAWRLRGELEAGALRDALAEVTRRHEALRVAFEERDGEAVARDTGRSAGLTVVDLAGLPAERREGEMRRLLRAEADAPFDLEHGPLLRSFLARLDPREHVWMLDMHHIVSDGWSLGVFAREVSRLYAGRVLGLPVSLPALPVQYADFAAWQRGWLETGVLEPQLAWWRERLAGLEVLELPTDRPRPPVRTYRGATRRRALPASLRDGLARCGRERGVTRFMILLAATAALLERYTGRADVAVGSPVAGRTRPEIENLIGLFVNTLVLRIDTGGDPTFAGLLARVRETTLGAFAHQDLPFERLVEALRPDRHLAHNPLFELLFSAANEPLPAPELQGVSVLPEPVENTAAKLDLSLTVRETGECLEVVVDYDADLFDAPTIDRLEACFETLLTSALARPEVRVADLPLLSAEEIVHLQAEWSVPPPPPEERCLHELFAAQAVRTPDAPALRCGEEVLTYGELHARSGRLAGRLRAFGIGPEVPVGVCLGRSPDLIVALLAVLEAGGAYVPLDPAYPADRLAFTLEDSGALVLLTEERWRELFPATRARIVTLEEAGAEQGPATAASPDHLAYVIYTSGSTGRPKGVAITHRSAVALVRWALGAYAPDELAAVFAATSVCFDLSVFEIFVPLACGGTVVLGENALALSGSGEVTLVNSVPSALAELVEAGAVPPSVRVVNLAGEPLPRALADRIYGIPTVRRLLNLYGPTEDTTYSTFQEVPRAAAGEPSIGVPLPGTRAYVLDAQQRLLPPGVPGELLLAGDGLARGYLGRPDLTAERFLPDPFGEVPGARMYRTGDLVRRRAGRELEFLGRLDHQVKVRGFRIELGEIEALLCSHPAVRQAAALVREDAPGDRRLVGYVEAADGAPAAADMRALLAARLPEHMIPPAFVILPSFPLLPNGKIDRRALARIAPEVRAGGSEPPRTEAERKVAAVWRELLGVEQIGVEDRFFDLGGHSLLLMRASARLRAAFGVELSLVELFRYPDVRSLARRLEAGDGTEPETDGERVERMRRGKDRLRERAVRRRGTDKGERN